MKKKPKTLSVEELQHRVEKLKEKLNRETQFWSSELRQMHLPVGGEKGLVARIEALEKRKDGAA